MQVRVDNEVRNKIEKCVLLYREHHPELEKINISKNKILHEIAKFYLEGTKYATK